MSPGGHHDPAAAAPRTSSQARGFVRTLTFVSDGRRRRVDLLAPRPVHREVGWVVRLMDLWVASALPGDFLDLAFEVATARSVCAATLTPEPFARGFVVLATRELWWEAEEAGVPRGLRARSIVARRSAPARIEPVQVAPAERPQPVLVVAPYAVGYPFGACRWG